MAQIDRLAQKAKEHLGSDEPVKAALVGRYEAKRLGHDWVRTGIFIATDTRVVFYAKKMIGFEMESFPYSNISSIEMSKGILGHSISFFASGNNVKMKWIQNKKDIQTFVEYVRQHIGKKASAASVVTLDITDQIKKLAELKETGILSDEEFATKKKELLAKI